MAEEQKTQQDLKLIENFVSALTIEVAESKRKLVKSYSLKKIIFNRFILLKNEF